MAGKGRGGDGLKDLGKRDGARWWEGRLTYTDPRTGKKMSPRVTFQADNRNLAKLERARLIEARRSGLAVPDGQRHRLNEAIDIYLAGIDTHSTKQGRTSAGKHVRRAFGEWFVDMVTTHEMQAFLDTHPQSVPQRQSFRSILVLAFDVAVKERWVTANPAKALTVKRHKVRGAKKSLPPKRSLTLDEAALYLADVKAHENHETYLMLHTQLVLGCRFGEVTDLRWEDVDLESGFVVISHAQYQGVEGETKGRYARPSALDLGLRVELKEHKKTMAEQQWPGWQEFVFPRPLTGRKRKSNHVAASTIYWCIKRSLKRLGLVMPVGSHLARHTMQNVAREHGSALLLRKVMGHTSEQVQLSYTSAEQAEVINLADRIGGALRRTSGSESGSGRGGGGADP